nr:MAG TPA: hypothetical protein [Caudoviricetes sp.]
MLQHSPFLTNYNATLFTKKNRITSIISLRMEFLIMFTPFLSGLDLL